MPWRVNEVKHDAEKQAVDVRLELPKGTAWALPGMSESDECERVPDAPLALSRQLPLVPGQSSHRCQISAKGGLSCYSQSAMTFLLLKNKNTTEC